MGFSFSMLEFEAPLQTMEVVFGEAQAFHWAGPVHAPFKTKLKIQKDGRKFVFCDLSLR